MSSDPEAEAWWLSQHARDELVEGRSTDELVEHKDAPDPIVRQLILDELRRRGWSDAEK